jgi:hypothetical protein
MDLEKVSIVVRNGLILLYIVDPLVTPKTAMSNQSMEWVFTYSREMDGV